MPTLRPSFVFAVLSSFVAIPAVSPAQQIIDTIPLPNLTQNHIALNPATNKIYVSGYVIDGADDIPTQTDFFADGPIAVDSTRNLIYAVNTAGSQLVILNGANNHVTTVNLLGSTFFASGAIAVNPVTNKIYVTCLTEVDVIDGDTLHVHSLTAGDFPRSIVLNPVTNQVYVGDLSDPFVTVIDGSENKRTIPVPQSSTVMAVNVVTDEIYVLSQGDINHHQWTPLHN